MSDKPSLIIRLRALGWALNLTRLNLLMLIATTVLVSVPQGRDLLSSMADDAHLGDYFSLLGSTLIWATSIWLWARVLLDINFPDAPVTARQLRHWRKWLPRLLGPLAFVAVTVNLWLATEFSLLVALLALEGVAFSVFIVKRRAIARWLAERLRGPDARNSILWAEDIDSDKHRALFHSLRDALQGMRGRFALLTLILGVVLGIWGLSFPLSLGQQLDTLLLLMLWGATLLPIGSVITYLGNRHGVPVMILLTILVLGGSFNNDNHQIRILDDQQPEQRPALLASLEAWQAEHCDNQGCAPFVMVATAGGGIRAAYWTGTVLGDLHDCLKGAADDPACPKTKPAPLEDYLFGVSGVSGGSVGATVYRTVAANSKPEQTIQDTVQKILGEDYLGPVSAGLLYPDMAQRFIPWVATIDRAEVFEQGLEAGFARYQAEAPHQLSGSFIAAAHYRGKPWPALLLNSTWSDNGRRIVASTLDGTALSPDGDKPEDGVPPLLYKDLLRTFGNDMRLSTAAHNSARFPVVSPAGGWKPVDAPQGSQIEWQRLQDGGLFENYGAETALEVLEVARSVMGEQFRPLVILISSDPTLPQALSDFAWNEPLSFAYEVRSTFHTYATTRVGRGTEAASRLQGWAESPANQGRATFAYFRMCAEDNAEEPPLGWALSERAQADIDSFLHGNGACAKLNQLARSKVLQTLAPHAR